MHKEHDVGVQILYELMKPAASTKPKYGATEDTSAFVAPFSSFAPVRKGKTQGYKVQDQYALKQLSHEGNRVNLDKDIGTPFFAGGLKVVVRLKTASDRGL